MKGLRLGSRYNDKNPLFDKRLTHSESKFFIDSQDLDRGPASTSPTDKLRSLPPKVATPILLARVEQRNDIATTGVDARQVRSLVGITVETCQTEVFQRIIAGVLDRDDVINLKVELRIHRWQMAILASPIRTIPNCLLGPPIHEVSDSCSRKAIRAFDLSNSKIRPARR